MKYPQLKKSFLLCSIRKSVQGGQFTGETCAAPGPEGSCGGLLLLLPEVQGIQSHKKLVCRQSLSRVIHSGNFTKKYAPVL